MMTTIVGRSPKKKFGEVLPRQPRLVKVFTAIFWLCHSVAAPFPSSAAVTLWLFKASEVLTHLTLLLIHSQALHCTAINTCLTCQKWDLLYSVTLLTLKPAYVGGEFSVHFTCMVFALNKQTSGEHANQKKQPCSLSCKT